MLFKPRHISLIRDGTKTQTRRDWADGYPGPNVGTVVAAKTELFEPDDESDCFIEITGRREERLGDISEADARAEGGYGVADFREAWRQINGEWDPDQVVDVIEFEYVGRSRPGQEVNTRDR